MYIIFKSINKFNIRLHMNKTINHFASLYLHIRWQMKVIYIQINIYITNNERQALKFKKKYIIKQKIIINTLSKNLRVQQQQTYIQNLIYNIYIQQTNSIFKFYCLKWFNNKHISLIHSLISHIYIYYKCAALYK